MRRTALVLSCVLASCSFVDDFDKFRAGSSGSDGDGGEPDLNELDGGPLDGLDSQVDLSDRDAGGPIGNGGRDAEAEDTGSTLPPGDAGPAPRCGDGNVDNALGEKCDDGNNIAGDGCEPVTCTLTPPAVCNGISCNDNDACTVDTCAPILGCANRAIDADKDGFSPALCKPGSLAKGGDCNDANAAINPNAAELCDGIDNDCDGMIDETLSSLRCYPDRDGDGFANLDGTPRMACVCPAAHIPIANPNDRTKHDCYDEPGAVGASVFPQQNKFFTEPYGTGSKADRSFDYDCSGKADLQYEALGAASCGLLGLLLCDAQGFLGEKPPACGVVADYTICTGTVCSAETSSRTQGCH